MEPAFPEIRGFIPKTQQIGSTASVQHYDCFSRVIASLTCRELEPPRKSDFDDFGAAPQSGPVRNAQEACAQFKEPLITQLRRKKSEAGEKIGYLQSAIIFEKSRPDEIAGLPIFVRRKQRIFFYWRFKCGKEASHLWHESKSLQGWADLEKRP